MMITTEEYLREKGLKEAAEAKVRELKIIIRQLQSDPHRETQVVSEPESQDAPE